MLGSPTSSGSVTSLMSTKNQDKKRQSMLPEKFRKNSIITRKVFLDEEEFYSIITNDCELIECKDGEILNYLNLQSHFPDDEVQIAKKKNVDIEIIIGEGDSAVYAVKIDSMLFGIERRSAQLKMLKVLTKVYSIKCVVDRDTGDISVLVTFTDKKKLLTNFLDEQLECFMQNKNTETFNSVLECVTQKTTSAQNQLDKLTQEIEEISLKLQGEIPSSMLQDVSWHRFMHLKTKFNILPKDPNEKSPLVRYGSIWTRVINEKLIVGIPIACFSKRSVKFFMQKYFDFIVSPFNKFSNWTISYNLRKNFFS
jgi:predicted house-cleaning noncanonical NTP pyrophosphatase (MazG superfamily)